MELLYADNKIIVCVKPAGVLSTDEPGGMPSLLRAALGEKSAPIYTVHRLDAAVGGVMVYARTRHAASDLGKAMQRGELCDLLRRDTALRKTFVAAVPGKDTREARLGYERLGVRGGLALYRIRLYTGRAHQIRCQLAARGAPLWGDGKYGGSGEGCIALFSCALSFPHPVTGERMTFEKMPDAVYPWTEFGEELSWKQS